jgi:D-alanine transaminase
LLLAFRHNQRQGWGMSRIVFLNGAFLPYEAARLPVMDRGFLFADGVYEVSAVLDGKLVDNEAHLARLERSLGELGITPPYTSAEWIGFQTELIRRNELSEGVVYLQVTRGVAERAFTFAPDLVPTTVMFTQVMRLIGAPLAETGADVITVPDIRWQRRDIKSTGLLAQVLAKQQAHQAGAAEAFMVEDGFVTEGASSSVFVITKAGVILTRPLSNAILPGITRQAVMRLASEEVLTIEERAFTVAETLEAAEVFYTSASSFVIPVVRIDGAVVADGRPGRFATRLRALYIEMARHL